jgi:hypothetical protein
VRVRRLLRGCAGFEHGLVQSPLKRCTAAFELAQLGSHLQHNTLQLARHVATQCNIATGLAATARYVYSLRSACLQIGQANTRAKRTMLLGHADLLALNRNVSRLVRFGIASFCF